MSSATPKFLQPKAGFRLDDPAGDDPPRATAAELADIVLVFQRRLLARLSQELAPGGVSFTQFFLLDAFGSGKTLTMSEIAARMGNTTAAATGLVDRLENLGHVERAHATDDRRKVLVRRTDLGAALVGRIKEDMIGNLRVVMTHLSPAEQKSWLAIYRKIHSVCEEPTRCG